MSHDTWHKTYDKQHLTPDTWQMTHDTRQTQKVSATKLLASTNQLSRTGDSASSPVQAETRIIKIEILSCPGIQEARTLLHCLKPKSCRLPTLLNNVKLYWWTYCQRCPASFYPFSQFVPQLEHYSQLQLSLWSDPIALSVPIFNMVSASGDPRWWKPSWNPNEEVVKVCAFSDF